MLSFFLIYYYNSKLYDIQWLWLKCIASNERDFLAFFTTRRTCSTVCNVPLKSRCCRFWFYLMKLPSSRSGSSLSNGLKAMLSDFILKLTLTACMNLVILFVLILFQLMSIVCMLGFFSPISLQRRSMERLSRPPTLLIVRTCRRVSVYISFKIDVMSP